MNAIKGTAVSVASTGAGKFTIATFVAVLGQDAAHKSGIGQYPKYQMEKWANGGTHPSGKPFTFKDNGPSWGGQHK
jgi:hypothetical protein